MGKNFITGTFEDEIIRGTVTGDIIYAMGGNDTVYGYRGDDEIADNRLVDIETAYNDTYHGGRGHDIITSYSGNDVMFGGRGNDVIFVRSDILDPRPSDHVEVYGGRGYDVFLIEGTESNYHQEFMPYGHVTITSDDGEHTIVLEDIERIVFTYDHSDWLHWIR